MWSPQSLTQTEVLRLIIMVAECIWPYMVPKTAVRHSVWACGCFSVVFMKRTLLPLVSCAFGTVLEHVFRAWPPVETGGWTSFHSSLTFSLDLKTSKASIAFRFCCVCAVAGRFLFVLFRSTWAQTQGFTYQRGALCQLCLIPSPGWF